MYTRMVFNAQARPHYTLISGVGFFDTKTAKLWKASFNVKPA